MKKELRILVILIAVLLVGTVGYYFMPKKFGVFCYPIGILSESAKGWKKELNMISWNGAAEKYDIRDGAPEHEKMGKGITLSQEEAEALYELLGKTLKK